MVCYWFNKHSIHCQTSKLIHHYDFWIASIINFMILCFSSLICSSPICFRIFFTSPWLSSSSPSSTSTTKSDSTSALIIAAQFSYTFCACVFGTTCPFYLSLSPSSTHNIHSRRMHDSLNHPLAIPLHIERSSAHHSARQNHTRCHHRPPVLDVNRAAFARLLVI